jgi:hypothetical protein
MHVAILVAARPLGGKLNSRSGGGLMRWMEIAEFQTARDAAEEAAKERRERERIDAARRAKSDAARKYQNDTQKADDKIETAVTSLRQE